MSWTISELRAELAQGDELMTIAISGGVEAFIANQPDQDVVAWRLYRIAEGTCQLASEARGQYPTVAWPELRKLRNRLAHHFRTINPVFIFVYSAMEVPKMRHALRETTAP